jgi:hypothetical protein
MNRAAAPPLPRYVPIRVLLEPVFGHHEIRMVGCGVGRRAFVDREDVQPRAEHFCRDVRIRRDARNVSPAPFGLGERTDHVGVGHRLRREPRNALRRLRRGTGRDCPFEEPSQPRVGCRCLRVDEDTEEVDGFRRRLGCPFSRRLRASLSRSGQCQQHEQREMLKPHRSSSNPRRAVTVRLCTP